jgi:hypothetical protein
MSKDIEGERLYQAYRDYASHLRSWFVGYGVGLAVYILGDDQLNQKLGGTSLLSWMLLMVVLGIAVQIYLSLMNKKINWYCYRDATDESFRLRNWREVSKSYDLIDNFSIDRWCDRLTLTFFGIPTVALLAVIFGVDIVTLTNLS